MHFVAEAWAEGMQTLGPGKQDWLCCQLGAREHYAVPRALHRSSSLNSLLTDMWVCPGSWFARRKRNLRERFHLGLADARVYAFNTRALAFEAQSRLQRLTGWKLITARNRWFQRRTIAQLTNCAARRKNSTVSLFAYSYAANGLLDFARKHGWRTVLGQIDPGQPEERIVAKLYEENPAQRGHWQPAPPEYWQQWHQECALADCIVVNSLWSRDALVQESIPAKKIRVVPLAFEPTPETESFLRYYPKAFSTERPLRVLFLGQINLRKGVWPLLEAARLLRDEAVEFWFVGPIQVVVPEEVQREARIRWIGPVPRGEVAKYYREADVFIFPTFSDGFGLTQLEAQAWKLPVIASRFCGDVVQNGRNGIVLSEVSGTEIAKALYDFLQNPVRLADMATCSGAKSKFSLNSLASSLLEL